MLSCCVANGFNKGPMVTVRVGVTHNFKNLKFKTFYEVPPVVVVGLTDSAGFDPIAWYGPRVPFEELRLKNGRAADAREGKWGRGLSGDVC